MVRQYGIMVLGREDLGLISIGGTPAKPSVPEHHRWAMAWTNTIKAVPTRDFTPPTTRYGIRIREPHHGPASVPVRGTAGQTLRSSPRTARVEASAFTAIVRRRPNKFTMPGVPRHHS